MVDRNPVHPKKVVLGAVGLVADLAADREAGDQMADAALMVVTATGRLEAEGEIVSLKKT